MTVDDYMGGVTRRKTPFPPPPPETVAAFNDALGRALSLARERVAANPRDADAHYEVGAAMGLRASYTATVDSSTMGAFKAAREAYDEHEKVLKLDTRRKDAGLIVGTYRYIVASLSMPLRWAAYMVGFGGGREQGLQLVEGAASYVGDNQEEARFTLVVLYNREKQYDAALAHLATLRERYPRNRLAWLESGSTSLRAGKTADAERYLDEGTAPVRERHAPAHVRRRRALVREARNGAREPRPQAGGPGRSREGAEPRRARLAPRPRAPRAGQAGSEGRQTGSRQRTFANGRPSV